MAPKRIMVVEDEVVTSAGLRMSLEEIGYRVSAAVTSGEEAVLLAGRDRPDLILMDIALSGSMDGIEAAARIRAARNTPIVFLTAYADGDNLERAKAAEPFGFLIKPFNTKELKATLEIAFYKADMEARLRLSEERLAATLRSIGDAVITTDLDGRIVYLNPVARSLTGWDQEQASGSPLEDVFQIVNPVTGRPVDNPAEAVIRESRVVTFGSQCRLVAGDGSLIPIEISASPITDRRGDISGVVLVFRDITERKEAEEALRRSEKRFRTLIQEVQAGVLVRDSETRIVTANAAAQAILGVSGEPLTGLQGVDPDWIFLHEDGREMCAEELPFNRVIANGRPLRDFLFGFREPDGGAVKWLLANAGPLFDEAGRIDQVIIVFMDITDRKRAEAALRESEERYRVLIDTIPHGVQELDPDGRIVFGNPLHDRIYGYKTGELAGRYIHDLPASDSGKTELKNRLKRLVTDKPPPQPYETTVMTPEGRLVDVKVDWNYKRNDRGDVTGFISVITDITRRKQLEIQLLQAQKLQAIGTLAGGIAHEFNNILAAIMGYTELTLDDLPEALPSRRNLEMVLKSGRRAKNLVQQIISFSRPADLEKKPVPIRRVVEEVLRLLDTSLPPSIVIRRDIGDTGVILADPVQLHQLLMHLCLNSAHALNKEGGILDVKLTRVEIDAEAAAGYLDIRPGPYQQLTVRDTGPGMTRDVLDRIFDPFFTTKKIGEGTGIGLALVHGIVKGHGGAITVVSEPGIGTAATVFLPLTDAAAESPATLQPEPEDVLKGHEHILFIDDEEALTDLGRRTLEPLGYRVSAFNSGTDALEAFKKQPDEFDLVFTDQTMPRITGVELARQMIGIRPDLPVILYTGYSESFTAGKTSGTGIRRVLHKPLNVWDTARAVRAVLDEGRG